MNATATATAKRCNCCGLLETSVDATYCESCQTNFRKNAKVFAVNADTPEWV